MYSEISDSLSSPLNGKRSPYFVEERRIDAGLLPSTSFRNPSAASEVTRCFVDRFPVFPTPRSVRFTYFDHGASTPKPFLRHLKLYSRLFSAVQAFELEYVSLSGRAEMEARQAFHKLFQQTGGRPDKRLFPLGANHLVDFFEAEDKWNRNDPDFGNEHLRLLREGEPIYTQSEHEFLRGAWRSGTRDFNGKLAELTGGMSVEGSIRTLTLNGNYPVYAWGRRILQRR